MFKDDSEEAQYASERFHEVVLMFEDEMEKDDFMSFVYCRKEDLMKKIEQLSEEYSWIEVEGKLAKNEIITRLKTGISLNSMLQEFRH